MNALVSTTLIALAVMALATHSLFAFLLKAPTREGRALLDEIEGLRVYLGVAEREAAHGRIVAADRVGCGGVASGGLGIAQVAWVEGFERWTSGESILAFQPPELIRRVLSRKLPAVTSGTVVDAAALREHEAVIRILLKPEGEPSDPTHPETDILQMEAPVR